MIDQNITAIRGFQAAGVHCGLKRDGALDFAMIVSETPCTAAAVFTTNYVKAAPVLLDMEHLKTHAHSIRAIAINSKCANACTGQQGMDNARETARYIAEKIGCTEQEVLVMSTGVIGAQLNMEKIKHGVNLALDNLGDNWEAAARAIMTTDTRPKMAFVSHGAYTVGGIAKGAGMIAPNMATMLGFIVTDANIGSPAQAYETLKSAANMSFNRIIVDGDMSTNDTVILLSTNRQEMDHHFESDLNTLSKTLAKAIVSDGEGATKLVNVQITGTESDAMANQIATAIGTSPLVKTAFFGSDPNWGRILAAAGRAGVPLDMNKMSLWIGTVDEDDQIIKRLQLVKNGTPTDYIEADAAAIMSEQALLIELSCGTGQGNAQVWTTDLSHDYVSINADYRT